MLYTTLEICNLKHLNLITKIQSNYPKTPQELSFLERNSGIAPMPDATGGTEAAVRVYNLDVDLSVAKDRNGNVFGAKKAAEN